MADIKTKKKQEFNIKKFDRATIMGKNLKENTVNIKDKTKGSYEDNKETAQEYAENKVNTSIKDTVYNIPRLNNKGKQNLEKTKENIANGKVKIKKAQKGIKNIKRKGRIAIKKTKRNVKKFQNSIKSVQNKIKTAQRTVKTTKQVAKTSIKVLQKSAQMTKQAVKTTIKAIQVAIKSAIAIIKAIILATKALISAIIAGGWVAVVIIVVICLIAMLCTSIFGIFFSNEDEIGEKNMSSVIRELNTEFTNRITEIQKNNEHDEFEINSNKAQWKDIISIYAVVISKGEEQTELVTLDDNKINQLKEIFWQMNTITSRVDEIEKEYEITDENGNTKTEKKKIKMLHIDITSKSLQEMIELYNLNPKQKEQIAELQKEEYNSMWSYMLAGATGGSNDIVEVAKQYIGNVGGQPFWSWYGFSNRVEWCACFVSFCANECGYIEAGIIPKFASCQSEGVAWFQTCGLWQDRSYTPKARRYNLF